MIFKHENMNPHTEYINKRIEEVKKSSRYDKYTAKLEMTHKHFVDAFGTCLFTNFTRNIFTKTYLKKFHVLTVEDVLRKDVTVKMKDVFY